MDIVDDIMARLRAKAPELPDDVLHQVAVEVGEEWGGRRCYVRQRQAERHALVLGSQIRAGASIGEAVAAAGIDRTYAWRILSRPMRRPGR